ncbi:putative transposase [Escherichia coli E22]|nr:putative transposase [Escherichia coli E22]
MYEVRGQPKGTIIYCDSNNGGVSFYHHSVFRLTRLCDY